MNHSLITMIIIGMIVGLVTAAAGITAGMWQFWAILSLIWLRDLYLNLIDYAVGYKQAVQVPPDDPKP
jgi:hypothetical protein